ncbi:MAG TPA: LCP family protein [Candidatus Dormibacteraeota bacterium]
MSRPDRRRRRSALGRLTRRSSGASVPLSPPAGERVSMRRRILLSLLIAGGFVLSGFAGTIAYFMPAIRTGLSSTGQAAGLPAPTAAVGAATTSVTARPQPGSNDPFTVLLLGSDNDAKFSGDHLLTQSMILVRVEPATKRVTLLSIPRDLYVPIDCASGSQKIDTAYSYGGARCAVSTVQTNFHVHIDHYVWIGLKGLVSLIDQLGGVDVVTTNPVLDDFYPADLAGGNPFAYERVAVLPGAQHLDGLHAMEYVRSRHGDLREDFGRSERQQQVLLALRAKARNLSVFDLPDIAGSLSGQLTTDMGITQVGGLLPLAAGLDLKNVNRVLLLPPYTHGQIVGNQDVVVPDWNLILPLVAQSFPS